jgi:serine protease Do
MKKITISSLTAALASILGVPVFALEAPADNAPPPPPLAGKEVTALPKIKLSKPATKPAVETAFLGVIHGPVPELLAGHLDLQAGEGAVVLSMPPDSPAARAGLAVDDIITHVAGQSVDTQTGLAQRISDHRPNAGVTLVVIRKGKPTSVEVTLGTRPLKLASSKPKPLDPLDLHDLPDDLAERIRATIGENVKGMKLGVMPDLGQLAELQKMLELPQQLDQQLLGIMGKTILNTECNAAVIRIQDQEGCVERKMNNGSATVTVRDEHQEVMWSGPWNTAEEKAAAPESVAKRIEACGIDQMVAGKGNRFLFQGHAPLGDEEE